MVETAAVGNATPKRFHLLVLCSISMAAGVGATAAYTRWEAGQPLPVQATAGMSAPNSTPAAQPAPTIQQAPAAAPSARSGAIRAHYTDSGVTVASYFPVAMAGASTPCGSPISSAPLCRGVQIQCEPAADGVYRWKVSGFCE